MTPDEFADAAKPTDTSEIVLRVVIYRNGVCEVRGSMGKKHAAARLRQIADTWDPQEPG